MTAATVTAKRPAAEQAGFGRLLYAGWTKFVTVRRWVIAMVVSAPQTAGIRIWATSATTSAPNPSDRPEDKPAGSN